MTLFWLRPTHTPASPVAADDAPCGDLEFDEDGRQYVFRFTANPQRHYHIDRDRIFDYVKSHEMPGARARQIRRDLTNAANFYEDVREIQTHPDVVVAEPEPSGNSVTRLRMRKTEELPSAS